MSNVVTLRPKKERSDEEIDAIVERMWGDYSVRDIHLELTLRFGQRISRHQPYASWQRIKRRMEMG